MEFEESEPDNESQPLTNELILETVVQYIRRRDLLRCRFVCKQWNSFVLRLRVRHEFQVRLGESSLGKYSRLSRFLSLVDSSIEIPYGSYLIINLRMNDPLVERFFLTCGSHIRILRIQLMSSDIDICGLRELLLYRAPYLQTLSTEGCGLPDEVTTHPNLFPVWPGYQDRGDLPLTLPNLQTIHFKTEEGQKLHPNFIQELLKASKNLKSFMSTKNSDASHSTLILSAIRDSGIFINLSCLHLMKLNNSQIEDLIQLSQLGLTLKDFSFKFLLPDVSCSNLQQFINLQCKSCRSLSFGEIMGTQDLSIKFPVMKNLKRLTRTAISLPTMLFGYNVCYATNMPNLEELVVSAFADEVDWGEYYSEVNNLYTCNSLKKLELPIHLKDPMKLQKLGEMFPNVTEVITNSPGNEVVSQLWNLWPELEELRMSLTDRNENIDTVFTGIPQKTCGLVGLSKNYEEVDIERIRVGPSIGNLRRLRKLHLETSPRDFFEDLSLKDPTCLLTDITGYLGLSFLTQLEEVTINSCEMTEDCCLALSKRFQKYAKVYICDRNHIPLFTANRLQ